MIKINLNIQMDDLKPEKDFKDKTGIEIATNFITTAFNYLQSIPKRPGDPASAGLKVSEQRKIYKILDCLDKHKEGIVEFEDDLHNYLKNSFNEVNWSGGTKIVVRVADALDEVIKE